MLTQFQIIERQAALFAARPRPRTLALSGMNTGGINTSGMNTGGSNTHGSTLSASFVTALSAPSVSSVWSHRAPISFGFGVDERPAAVGYAGASLPVPMAAVRPDFAALVAEGNGTARRNGGELVATGANGSNNGTQQQDKQYLTARRGPVTWRPPH